MKFDRMLRQFTVLAAVAGLGILGPSAIAPAQADIFLEESGTIVPTEHSYTFEGSKDAAVTLTLTSEAFDTMLVLYDSLGIEIASNDDFGGTLNSQITLTLPADDTYTVVVRSFTGQGGDYDLAVRSATPFEMAYGEGQDRLQVGDYEGAIAAYTQAIEADPSQPLGYLSRADAYLGKLNAEQGDNLTGPEDIPAEARAAMIADYESAADLIETAGNTDWATALREQANYLRSTATP